MESDKYISQGFRGQETWDEVKKRLAEPTDGGAEDDELLRKARLAELLESFRRDHDFMFVKRRDDDDWHEFAREVLSA